MGKQVINSLRELVTTYTLIVWKQQLAELDLYEGMNFTYLFDLLFNTKGESPQQYPDW